MHTFKGMLRLSLDILLWRVRDVICIESDNVSIFEQHVTAFFDSGW